MKSFGAKPAVDRRDPTPDELVALEARFEITLPQDYRRFVFTHGSTYVDADVPFREPTPCGRATVVASFCGFTRDRRAATSLIDAIELVDGHGIAAPIAKTLFGDFFFLVCGRDHPYLGRVLLRDSEQRHTWPDDKFHTMFADLAPEIEHYLELRRTQQLLPPLSGLAGWYLVGDSFDDFLSSCRATSAEHA